MSWAVQQLDGLCWGERTPRFCLPPPGRLR